MTFASSHPNISLDSIPFDKSNDWIKKNCFYLCCHGSWAYGLNTPESDIDLRGVCFGPKQQYIGFEKNFDQFIQNGDLDVTIFEFRKFLSLCAKGNPNALEILFVPDHCIVYQTDIGEKLRNMKEVFLSKKVRYTLSGYAASQLKRINIHYRWLKNPPTALPTRDEFGLPSYREVAKDKLEAALAVIKHEMEEWEFNWDNLSEVDRIALQAEYENHLLKFHLSKEDYKFFENSAYKLGYHENFIDILVREKQYRAKVKEFQSYEHWKKTRNPKRAAIEAKFGYDLKHASHLVRLIKMCKEVLLTGKLNVDRTGIDREELMAIKNEGLLTYENLMEWVEKEEKEIADIFKKCTILPDKPDHEKINKFCESMIIQHVHKEMIEAENKRK